MRPSIHRSGRTLIGLDVGTTGCKAMVFDEDGCVLGRAQREYGLRCDAPGMAEQDPDQVWGLCRESLREAVLAAAPSRPLALSVSVQGDAIIPVDRGFRPLRPALLGMDYRSAGQARACAERFGDRELFRRTGMRPHPMNSLCKLLWLRDTEPAVLDRAWKVVTYADFILGRLGAGAVMDHTMASRTMAFDLATQAWSEEMHAALGLDSGLWSAAVASGTGVGEVGAEVAEALALPAGMLLVAGGHDQTCAAVGAGVIGPGRGVVSTGTAEVLSTAFDGAADADRMFRGYYPCYLHAQPGQRFTFALNHVGGILLRWWRDQFATAEVADAAAAGVEAYRLIDERMPEGPSPVMVVPHLNGTGTPHCDLDAQGAIVGLTLATTRHDVAKALLEGLAFELRVNLEAMRACGIGIAELVAVGGGAKSDRWLQLKADVLGRPVSTLRCGEAACLGAALLAGVGAGVYGSLGEAVTRVVRPDRIFEPRPTHAAIYAGRFETYQRLYPALREARFAA